MKLFRSVIYRIANDTRYRKIVLCGCNEFSKAIYKKLFLLDIMVDCFIEKEPSKVFFCDRPVKSYKDILHEDLQKIRIIITENNHVEELEALGLKRVKNFRTIHYNESLRQEYRLDANLGYNLVLDGEIPGFKCFGNKEAENLIVTLGNSTSDPELYPFKCWSEILGEKFLNENKDIKILCGAVSGHMSPQELIKLIRDVVPLHPQKVICYEGFQDINNMFRNTSYPFISQYQKKLLSSSNIDNWIDIYYTKGYSYGVNNECSPYNLWKNSMKMMRAICKEYNIEFIGILQPCIFNKMHCLTKDEWEIVLHYELRDDMLKWFEQFFTEYKDDNSKLEFIYDFTDIFNKEKEIYIDNCHIYEKGNQIIAEKMYSDFFECEE